ncbi:histidine kinase dimerization/phospho-acceptor domain-containing protein [Clostridium tertium]|uniref:sensor histidine kinase n=1 Tax=Clostridium TaxID=1485 RepID=UPI000BE34D0F|nr:MULTISPECIES: sensor histidine kinase [Clostridium]MBU6136900.1 sensor histidine kinase [Clostridium tertium]MDB1955522.1 histidine kinase dimerization/phospho-acceptor domain-containing protein [Clostridium tertium]MDB1959220.1 histidine kinase dimerization/phospho-acceptor domain-containing protein [Clostridium tertium]MDB1961829.1 histidine kinase dimerization/phospho-acceptor domain-containing protein [Clostridium tertium]MDB1966683.1 histidine kinase dimerization/phospho-acceptor domai
MDTKLTKNKILKDLEKYIIFILVIFFAISLIGTLREYKNFNLYFGDSIYNNSLVKNKIVVLDSNLNDYTKLFLDLDGKKKEDIYNKKVEEFKLEKENRLKEAEENIREKAKDMNVAEAEIKKQIEEAKKIIMEEDNSVDDYFKYVREFTNNILYDNENIQFFFKDSSGAKITNIEDSNIEKQIEEKEFANNEQYYYMYFANSKVNEDGKNYSEELSSIYDLLKYSSEDLIRFYRIPKELKQGDLLYDAFKERKEASSILNRKIAITAILGVFILVFAFIIYKRRKNNYTNYIEDLLIKIPIDIRAIIFLYSLNILNSLIFNVIPYYGNNSYSNGVILRAYILIIIDYYFLKDLILILENKRKKGKVLTLKIYKYLSKIIKDSEFIKTNKFKFISIIFLSALALFCLWLESFVFLSYEFMVFSRAYICIYLIFTSILSVMIFREITILESQTLRIAKGNYKVDLKADKILVLKNIENNLITIEDGLKEALGKAITSEKMKSELITNVSHDLKTPLTSIINYIGFLKEENITDEKRSKYLEVLDMKSKRLKILIEDLFEASKAVSGNMTFEKEDLNIVSLLRQVIGELEEKITQANLDIITKWPEDKAIVYIDGRKTFRVYENLVNNIIKYSMKNSRVYIDVINSENEVKVIMKNISAYQIDFTSEEIIERFKRGDKSRSTEGSGLGLSIAKSIVELQGGNFDIEIDGDLFKVITTFRK